MQLPYGVRVSDGCRTLLHGLLQRDPEKRMSFEEFFESPFIDLQHRPQATSMTTAVRTISQRYIAVVCSRQFPNVRSMYDQNPVLFLLRLILPVFKVN